MKKTQLAFVLTISLLFIGCNNEDIEDDRINSNSVSNNEVKYFKIVKNALDFYRNNLTDNKALNDRNIDTHNIKWGITSILQDKNDHIILFVPIYSDLTQKVRYSLSIKLNRAEEIEEMYFIESNPSDSYYSKNSFKLYYEYFSGTVNIYDFDNRFLKSQNYSNGNILRTKGMLDDENYLSEIIIEGNIGSIKNWYSFWEYTNPEDIFWNIENYGCPLCGAPYDQLKVLNKELLFCQICGYGVGGGSGNSGGTNNSNGTDMYNGYDLNAMYGPLGDQYPWSGLTKKEKMFVINNPVPAKAFYDNANKAQQAVSSLPGQHNGQADAIRHAYWSALNARDYGDLAKQYGDAHEDNPSQPLNEKQMDLHNNEVGYQIGKEGKGDAVTPSWTDSQIHNAVMDAYNNGKLQTGLK